MKILPLILSIVAFTLSTTVYAAGPSVTVTVEDKTTKDSDPKNKEKTTVSKHLVIKLASRTPLENLKVQYFFVIRNVTTKTVTASPTRDITASIPATGTAQVESEVMKAELVDRHIANKKPVPASGEKILGYGVQVFNGADLAGEFFSSPEIKKSLPTAGGAAH